VSIYALWPFILEEAKGIKYGQPQVYITTKSAPKKQKTIVVGSVSA
jgi:hypothetical protein